VTLDGRPVTVDAVEIAPNTISILLDGQSFEIRVTPSPDGKLKLQTGRQEFTAEIIDPRAWSGRRHANVEAEGRQQIVAPMPVRSCDFSSKRETTSKPARAFWLSKP